MRPPGQPLAGDLLEKRIHRVLAVARACGHDTLVLGAWGCGAFKNDVARTARDFRHALETEFAARLRGRLRHHRLVAEQDVSRAVPRCVRSAAVP